MSYILDALRRAEAQRARGAVPTLHAPALGVGGGAGADLAPRPRRVGLWMLAVALLLIAAALGWWLARPAPPANSAPAPAVSLTPPPLPAAPSATPPPMPPALAPVAAPAARTVPAPVARPTVSPAPVAAQSAPAGAAAALPANPSTAAAPPQAAASSQAAAAVTRAILQRRELPPDLQRELPALAVSGTVYSSDPSQRLLMVNGELLHEGDRIGPELVVEEIRRKDAVLRYKGQRFSVSP